MKRLEKIIKDERNVGLDFIVHIQNENELNDLINVLTRCNFEIQFALEYNPDELKRWMEDIGKDNNFDVCFRIRNREDDKCVAYNPSIEHWRCFCNDIFEIRDGLIPAYVVYYCYEFITDIPLIKNIFALIGKHSLNIFLFHTFIRHHWFHEYTYSFKHFVLIALVLLAESLVISIVLEFIKKITHYNNLCSVIRNKMNKRFFSDVQMNTSK